MLSALKVWLIAAKPESLRGTLQVLKEPKDYQALKRCEATKELEKTCYKELMK